MTKKTSNIESEIDNFAFDNYSYDPISDQVWMDNYKAEKELTREDTWKRAAAACTVSENEEIRKKVENMFLSILANDQFVPGGRILSNLGVVGRKNTTQFNCFIHSPRDIGMKDSDSIDGIYELLKAQAKTLRSEGGYGINASFIRPEGAYIDGIGSRTPGVLKFMELWDKSSEILTMGSVKVVGGKRKNEKNKIRKGAQMLVLDVWHPDIEDFITAKQTSGRLTKFNMSVGITSGFMEALQNNKDWNLEFPDTTTSEYKSAWLGDMDEWKAAGYKTIVYKTVKAKTLWDLIMKSTYNRNEPGVLFLDVANKLNPVRWFELIKTTNPCGEVPMSTGVCNLGSINLVSFVKPKDFSYLNEPAQLEFDYEGFKKHVHIAIRFLDNVNDISPTPLPEYDRSVKEKRRIGLGVMGLGSLHVMLGIKYGSPESLKLVESIFRTKSETELLSSALLGKEKGSFEKFNREEYFGSYWWKNLRISPEVKKQIEEIGEMRNSHQSMNAPTGNTGIYARNVSGGIEPVFDINGYYRWSIVPEFQKRELVELGFEFPDALKNEWHETKHMKFSTRGDEQILKGSFEGRNYEVDKNRGLTVESFIEDYGVKFAKKFYGKAYDKMVKDGVIASAQQLSIKEHVDVLEVCAHYTNMSISKTVNVPNNYPFEDFKNLYFDAWKKNLKGITTYREGTMTAVLETKENNSKQQGSKKTNFGENHAPKRPETLECDIYHMTVKGERWNLFVGLYEGKPYEIFAGRAEYVSIPKSRTKGTIKKNGKFNLHINTGSDEEIVIKDLAKVFENITESAFTRTVSLALRHGVPVQYVVEQIEKGADKDSDMFSMSKALLRCLKNYIKDGTKATIKSCKQCGSADLVYQEGCVLCRSCLYSKCS